MTSRIYLASKSPRRREILAGLGYEICLLAPEASPASAPQTDEERRPGESARSYMLRTAREKALGAIRMIEEKNWKCCLSYQLTRQWFSVKPF